ncbi:CHAD domain-containing protein [Halomonas mongoliensis]|uniref:CHAD domain-containing protein n=1 Tax=Halomonas mongoliensis TaxID=321265 RepID=A0ABU1GKV1_9GAMM|nr:CHAD domain-containing protein [Halomonas mongoliensis]MDR5892435.1 CHAD domain-containing protein [Halomonas mongoliensis]
MLELYLLRHAKAKREGEKLPDAERPLSQRGRCQAAAMAPALMRWGALEGEVVSSPARRTRETLEAMAEALPEGTPAPVAHFDEALYTFDGEALRAWLQTLPEGNRRLLVVGHNPALLELARWLSSKAPDSLPTGGLLHLRLPGESWQALKKHAAEELACLIPEQVSHELFLRRAPAPPELRKADLAGRLQGQLGHLYRLVRALEPGVMAGIDPEFLHQYRVNLRRSRAIGEAVLATVRQAGNGKAPGLKKRLKTLKQRAQATSDLRDLDVFLESLAQAPPPLQASTRRALHDWLNERAREQHECLCRQLGQPDYAEQMQAWQAFLDGDGFWQALARLSASRVEAVLDERIAGHDSDLAALTPDAPDEAFHDLRKAVKRIRYLAELDPKRHRRFLKGLKQRQTLLGDFQDLCTRQAWIAAFAASSPKAPRRRQECDAWCDALEAQKRALREQIMALEPLCEPGPAAR